MSYSLDIKERAIILRQKGYSIKEIAEKLKISKSTSSYWLSSIKLNKKAQNRLEKRKILGQYKALATFKNKRKELIKEYNLEAINALSKINLNNNTFKLLCSFLFWAEGSKNTSYLSFINSDPVMITTFIKLLRLAYPLKEEKFRALVHIHEYHNETKIKDYWSKITKIPLTQFSKSYQKPHTKKRIREGYQGSLRIRYYDSKIALELRSIYNMLAAKLGA